MYTMTIVVYRCLGDGLYLGRLHWPVGVLCSIVCVQGGTEDRTTQLFRKNAATADILIAQF